MNLMKWLRKNNTKLMAVVVIVLMVAFIGGSSFSYIFRGSGGMNQAVAHYGHNRKKISRYDRMEAGQELEVLTALRADVILQSQDLRGLLLSEVLFSQSRNSGAALDVARQDIQRNRYRISDKQLSDIYKNRSAPSDIYWILLRDEAAAAGIYVRPEDVAQSLGAIISNPNSVNLFGTNSYAQVMQGLTNRFNVSEGYVLSTFGKLLAVFQYTQIACSIEDVTSSQVRHIASREAETVNAEFVRLEASAFADKSQTPSDEAVAEQFNRYKTEFPGAGSAANPFGFGYKLPDLVQFDYIVLKLPDVEAIIKPPTQEEAERYYQQNRTQLYSEQVPSNPNDSNSPTVSRPKSYAEVADSVRSELRRQRIITKAEQILGEAKTLADANLAPTESESGPPTLEQRREKARDYAKVAQEIGKKHNITLYSGRTGLLNGLTIQSDRYLSRMFLAGYSYNPVRLSQVLFSVKELGDNATILLSLPRAEMYASIGPARDPLVMRTFSMSNQIMMIARVVDARPAAPPENLDVAFSTQTLALGDPAEQKEKDKTFSARDEVIKDLRKVAAWDTTRTRAQEFLALATKDGWDKAVNQFNQLYGAQAKADPNDPNVFRQDQVMGQQRLSEEGFQVLAAQVANNPAADVILNEAKAEGQFANRLYALASAGDGTGPVPPQVLEFQPNQSFYVLKSLSVEHLTREDFQRMKAMVVRQEEHNQVQNLAVVYLKPENILKRTNFQFVKQANEAAEKGGQKQEESAQ
jgi:hypothetical protein